MAKNYPDYEDLVQQYQAGNITAVDYVINQSDDVTREYHQFCEDEGLELNTEQSALAFIDFREELFEQSVEN